MAQLAERSAVNRQVLGSIPSGGVFFSFVKKNYLIKKFFLTKSILEPRIELGTYRV